MILSLSIALAAPPEAYPVVAEVSLPPQGVVSIPLPADVIGLEPDGLSRSIRIRNAAGEDIPYAVVDSRSGDDPLLLGLAFRPLANGLWAVDAAERPLSALTLQFDDLDAPVRVAAATPDWGGTPVILYEAIEWGGERFDQLTVPVANRMGPFQLQVEPFSGAMPYLTRVTGSARNVATVDPIRELIPAPDPVLVESGMARYEIELPGARRVVAIRLLVDGDVFDRAVHAAVPSDRWEMSVPPVGNVRRIRVGGALIDLDRVAVDLQGQSLIIDVGTDRGRLLPITGFEIESVGASLFLRDAGEGPHQILAAGRDPDTSYDLAIALPELLAGDVATVAPPMFAPNPVWTPIPSREGVDGPGPTVNLARYRFERAIEAGAGWVQITLDPKVLAHARADLGDLRVVDSEGRGIPYLTEHSSREAPWEAGAIERTEEGSVSLLRVPLGGLEAPVASVIIETSATRFSRTLTLLRDRGRMTQPVRSVTWEAEDRGQTLALHIGETLGAEVLLRIENGDNPPLPITSVRVTTAGRTIRFRAPEGGARLVYGSRTEPFPNYDLALLRAEVARLPVAAAELGPEVALTGPALGAFDQLVVLGAVGLLAAGLVGMAWRAVRAVPDADQRAPAGPPILPESP